MGSEIKESNEVTCNNRLKLSLLVSRTKQLNTTRCAELRRVSRPLPTSSYHSSLQCAMLELEEELCAMEALD